MEKTWNAICGICGKRFEYQADFVSTSVKYIGGQGYLILSGACPGHHSNQEVKQAYTEGWPILASIKES